MTNILQQVQVFKKTFYSPFFRLPFTNIISFTDQTRFLKQLSFFSDSEITFSLFMMIPFVTLTDQGMKNHQT